ncbi:MAG TPA: MarR family transcriptional regulator [Herpetosiphonaceae bacterium]
MNRIEECISFLLGKAYQQVNAAAKRRLLPHGVTPVQYAVLNVLWQQDARSGAELGERLQLDSATMTGVLDRLVSAGLIERQADATDRRINRVVLTEAGRSLQQPLDQEMDALNVEIFGQLGAEDAERLRAMLWRLGKLSSRA